MPSNVVKKFAKDAKVPVTKVEEYWNEAKKSADKKFNSKNDQYWSYVTGIVKKRLQLAHTIINARYLFN